VIRVGREHAVFSFDAASPPAARVPAGGRVELETADCFSDQIEAEDDRLETVDWDAINPATGPVFVEGAAPGDTLAVHVERIEIADRGVMAVSDGFGVLAARIDGLRTFIVPIRDRLAHLPGGVRVPLAPMIGVIGLAPGGECVPTGSPGAHGGNLDTRLIGEGATVFLPVAVEGALLAAGDLHAAMGDGEICGTGVEVAGRVTLRLEVLKRPLEEPVVETSEIVATLSSSETLDAAARGATARMAELLVERLGLPLAEVTLAMSAAGDLRVSQVVDPLVTAHFAMPKSVLEMRTS
jgi:amidase